MSKRRILTAVDPAEAELVRLGEELDRLTALWRPTFDALQRAEAEFAEEVARRGIVHGSPSWWRARKALGVEDAIIREREALDAIDRVAEQILDAFSRSMRGIAVAARAMRHVAGLNERFDPNAEEPFDDWHDQRLDQFLAGIESAAK